MEQYDSHNFRKDQYQDLNRNIGLDTRKIANNANEYDTHLRNIFKDPSGTRKSQINREMYERILEETIARTQIAEMEKKQEEDQRRKKLEIEKAERQLLEQKILDKQRKLREEEEYKIQIARRNNEFETTPRRSNLTQNNQPNKSFDYMNSSNYTHTHNNEKPSGRIQVKHNPRDVIDDERMEELIEATRRFFVHTQLIEERIEKINEDNKSLEKKQIGYVRLTIIILAVIAVSLIIGIVFMSVGRS